MSRTKGEFKIVLLGEGRVGKTSIISRFVNDSFNENERSTTQATMYSVKAVPIGSSPSFASSARGSSSTSSGQRSVKLAVWDTAGQERFHALAPIYYRNAAGAMLVYDLCDADSLRKVQTWVKELRTVAGDGIRLVVCGNKCDRPASEQEVSPGEAQAVAAEVGAEHFFTSAKSGINVAEAFGAMAAAVYADAVQNGAGASSSGYGGGAVGPGASASVGEGVGSYETPGRRRRRRGVAADDQGASDLFMDYGEVPGASPGGGMRSAADYDGNLRRPAGAAGGGRPLTLADMAGPGAHGGGDEGGGGGSGGGCC